LAKTIKILIKRKNYDEALELCEDADVFCETFAREFPHRQNETLAVSRHIQQASLSLRKMKLEYDQISKAAL